MRIFGHPAHIMLVHFPSALFPMELVCYGLLLFTKEKSFAFAAYYAMIGGTVMGWFAAVTGATDLDKIPPCKPAIIKKAWLHGVINSFVLITYSVLVYLLSKRHPNLPEASLILLSIKGLMITFLIIGNYRGGELVLKHNVALDNPEQ